MYPGYRHALAIAIFGARIASGCGGVARPVRAWIIAGRHSLAPHRLAFLRLHSAPAGRQFSRREEEIAAAFSFKRYFSDPCVIPKCRVLKQVTIAFLPGDRRRNDLLLDGRRKARQRLRPSRGRPSGS